MEKILIKIGDFITHIRYILLGIFIVLFIFCLTTINKVKINDSIISYLPNDTETKQGLDLMNSEFGSLATIKFMINDISYDDALKIMNDIEKNKKVDKVLFNENYYKDSKALFLVELIDKDKEDVIDVYHNLEEKYDDYDYNIYADELEDATRGVGFVLICCVLIIITILLLTSKTYFEPIITFIVFGFSIILNKGSNYLLGEISYITDAISIVLQLALSIDYIIIFMNHYMKEINDTDDVILAIKKTTSKSISEILASSLTTIAGLMALVFMQLRIGGDIGVVLSKGIICSLLSVILFMPSLLCIFNKVIIKLKKKELNINLSKFAKFIVNYKIVFLPLFIIFVFVSACLIPKYKYVYNINTIKASSKSENILDLEEIEKTFGYNNNLIILIKNENEDYAKQLSYVNKLLENKNIESASSIASSMISDNLYLGSSLNYQEISQVLGVNDISTLGIYNYYLTLNGIEANQYEYRITIIDLLYFLNNNELPIPDEMKAKVSGYIKVIEDNKKFIETDNYTRIILNLNLDTEDKRVSKTIDYVRSVSEDNYKDVTLIGSSINASDLKDSFSKDNTIITFVTVFFIFLILIVTFRSFVLTTLLILTIEGSILINFGIATLFGNKIFFMSYIVVSAIQMGATIDYAIIIATRYLQLRKKYDKKDAIIGTLINCLPAVITSGLILVVAGFLIGYITTSSVISSIGIFLGVGTLISLIATIFILPAILYTCDKFFIKKKAK